MGDILHHPGFGITTTNQRYHTSCLWWLIPDILKLSLNDYEPQLVKDFTVVILLINYMWQDWVGKGDFQE